MDAIELLQTSELSYREVASKVGMRNYTLISRWMRGFRDNGIKILSKPKAHPPTILKKDFVKVSSKEHNRIKELEKQVRSFQIENVFLKELRKLRN